MRPKQLQRIGVFHIEEAILEVLFGKGDKYVERGKIAQKLGLKDTWGKSTTWENPIGIVYSILHKLEEDGRVELQRADNNRITAKLTSLERDRRANKANKREKVDTSTTKRIGEGNESVYLYYLPTYKRDAESKGLDHWPCNIGYTTDSAEKRVASQIGDQLPEKAILSLVIQTHDCKALEKRIHAELKRRERWIGADTVGTEWFSTNPTEVENIYLQGSDK